MSHSTLIPLMDAGGHGDYVEFGNSWGWAPRIWSVLAVRYLGWGKFSWMSLADTQPLWDLAGDKRLPDFERIAHAATFDRTWIPVEHAPRVAAALRRFDAEHPAGSYVSNISAIADAMESVAAKPGVAGVAVWGTSVSENPWREWHEESDTSVYLGHQDKGSQSIAAVLPDLFEAHP